MPVPQVIQILIARDKATHQPKGSAYIWFQRRREAELAIRRLNGSASAFPDPTNPQARPLLVTVAQGSVAPPGVSQPARALPHWPLYSCAVFLRCCAVVKCAGAAVLA